MELSTFNFQLRAFHFALRRAVRGMGNLHEEAGHRLKSKIAFYFHTRLLSFFQFYPLSFCERGGVVKNGSAEGKTIFNHKGLR
jgi:hypothetical protein